MTKKTTAASTAGRRVWHLTAVLALLLGIILGCSGLAQAAETAVGGQKKAAKTTAEKESEAGTTTQTETGQTETGQTEKPANANKWVKKNGYTFYYGDNGKKVKGLTKIGKRTYLFDRKGRQKIGWQKVDKTLDKKAGSGYYSYFQMKNGKQGYMVKGKAVNGISIGKNGKVKSGGKRLALLLQCAELVDSHTRPTWSTTEKMKTMWNWFQSNIGEHYITYRHYAGWGVDYGKACLDQKSASCEGMGCAWAFIANACGASNCYCVASGGHGWAEVNGLIYDPEWSRHSRADSYYGMSPSLSGVGGRPPYKSSGIYRELV